MTLPWDAQCISELPPGTFRCSPAVYEVHGDELEAVMRRSPRFKRVIVDETLPPDAVQLSEDLYDDLLAYLIRDRAGDQ